MQSVVNKALSKRPIKNKIVTWRELPYPFPWQGPYPFPWPWRTPNRCPWYCKCDRLRFHRKLIENNINI